ncbi:Syntaxin-like protein psy1 [Hypsizygus marmoreus]|uniref:Syntaxin-like protein psy1 n=1 Tax=Hypsizygus marmoreus TaxID=39966 RepID=A0A369JJ11_HYPMA|nr:Syntaxin-like protein psy1 [Hypsizygus marmoreus]
MSTRDRLAAARAHRSQTAQSHEMSNMNMSSHPIRDDQVQQDIGTTPGFLSEVVSIQDGIERMNANVAQISTLHARIMNVMDQGQSHDVAQLDQLATETRILSNELKERIKALERFPPGPDLQMRKNRAGLVRSKFIEAIQNYQRVEQEYRVKSRQRVERQLKIVKPDATPEEVAAVAEGGGQQIFAQALTSSSRYGESRMAFREVQDRQQDLKKMEETLAQLAQLFADMGMLVEQQQETIDIVETTARHVEADTEKAGEHTWRAVLSARSYRKGRWICFGIFLLIIAVLAIVLGVVFGKK